ncbi:MFS transporter, partial [Streptomyces sp. SID10116]|nr:MFS transporter [Streptomyces sp. SID10116]
MNPGRRITPTYGKALPREPPCGVRALESPAPEPDGPGPGPLTVAVLCLCVTLVVGMVSAVNLAVPALSRSALRPSAESVLWVVDGYVVVFACLLIPGGALADRLGRKRVLAAGMGLFTAGCALCAVAPGVGVVIAGRV